jgi:hypothetical protein
MEIRHAVEKLAREVKEFAAGRASDVERGAETPRLAAMLLQQYGRGVVAAVGVIYESPRIADPIQTLLDEETAKIDPLWKEHARERWDGRPADVVVSNA